MAVVPTKSTDKTGETPNPQIKVIEAFTDDQSPVIYSTLVRQLLATVPDKYLVGLESIVICNLSEQPRKFRTGTLPSRGRRIRRENVGGLYHGAWKGQKAWIQIFADKVPPLPLYVRWIRPLRELMFGQVLYHELGHHVHTIRPEYREKEDVADDWSIRFSIQYLRKAYWYLYPFLWSTSKLYRAYSRIRKSRVHR